MHCTRCGAKLAPGARFCVNCGSVVEAAPAQYAEPQQYAQPTQYAAPAQYADPAQYAQPAQYADPAQYAASGYAETPAPEKKEGLKIDVAAVKDQLVETLKPITDKLKPIFAKKAVRFGVIGGFALLLVLSIVIGVLTSGNGYVNVAQNTRLEEIDGTLNIIVNGKLIKNTIELGYETDYEGNPIESDGKKQYRDWSSSRSMDGKVTAVWVYGTVYEGEDSWSYHTAGDLYVINGKKLQKVAEDVYDYEVSITGKGIAYMTKNQRDEDDKFTTYTLSLYNVSSKKKTTVSDEVSSSSIALAPNGKSVAYFEADEGDEEGEIEYTLMYSTGKKSQKVTSNEVNLVGMSNSGKQIYVIRSNEDEEKDEYSLYSYNAKGDSTKLGKISYSRSVTFNKDRTQVIYTYDGKTYISSKGKEGIKAFNGDISLLTPAGASSNCYNVEPVSNFYGLTYATTDSDGDTNVYVIKKNSEKNAKLASKVRSAYLDESGEYLYYLYDGDEARMTKVSYGEKATEKYTVLAEDVDGFVVTPNRKYVYFLSDDTLYSVNGKKGGKRTIVCTEDIDYLDMTPEGRIYYISEDDLYTTNNGKKGQKVLSDIDSVYCTASGQTYAESEDTLYVSTGSKKLKKLMDLD